MGTNMTASGKIFLSVAKMANKIAPFYQAKNAPQASRYTSGPIHYWTLYDGEKNLGEIGPVKDYYPDYATLRVRSWQSYLESEISQTILNKFKTWIIGTGLKLQSEPANIVLKSEGLKETNEDLTQIIESRFGIYAKNTMSDLTGMNNLHLVADEAFKNAKIGGDVLVILHYINNQVKVQLIDGAFVQSPSVNNQRQTNGNYITHGVEVNELGDHVAYHLRIDRKTYRIPAVNNGIRTAFLIYGSKYRLDSHRGMPHIAVALESIKKLERYKEAMVGAAEERAKVAIFQEHKTMSTGESVFSERFVKAVNASGDGDVPIDINGNQIADTVAVTTNKQLINLNPDSTLKVLDSDVEFSFKEFYETNVNLLCSALEIPPNVAMSIYNDSFSASRAATKDWEHTIDVKRNEFAQAFYQRVYKFWFYTEVLKNKIQAPGFLKAFDDQDEMVVNAYLNTRWTGAMFPHIDPEKEARAERIKLGEAADHLPLTTLENSTEVLGGGDSEVNIQQFAREKEKAESLGIKPVDKPPKMPVQTTS